MTETPAPPATTAEKPWPVRTVSAKVSSWIGRLGEVWVEGQVAQLSLRPGAKTVFLTLRDPAADMSLTVTCRRDVIDAIRPPLADGARIVARTRPDFYTGRGTFSLRASEIRPVGVGELLARIERLRGILEAEGLTATSVKRPLPFLPGRVGLITGRASAARRDVEENTRLRWPGIDFRVIEVPVQGAEAGPRICAALDELDRDRSVDVIVLARGGGSVEDLLTFSDETLCRAVSRALTPVVSAIGHEQDRPLVDLVADVRASTPTDAAKHLVPDLAEETALIETGRSRLRRAIIGRIDTEERWLSGARGRPALGRPHAALDSHGAAVLADRDRARRHLQRLTYNSGTDVGHLLARVRTLSPAATLARGYAVLSHTGDRTGEIVAAAGDVADGETLTARLANGELTLTAQRPSDAEDPAPAQRPRKASTRSRKKPRTSTTEETP